MEIEGFMGNFMALSSVNYQDLAPVGSVYKVHKGLAYFGLLSTCKQDTDLIANE